MFKTLCILLALTVILCGCTTHQQRNTFKNFGQPPTSEIKTYTYAEARELSGDSDGNYNFFLLPGIDPDQAYAFERQFAKEQGLGYNVYTGAHPYTVDTLVYIDVPIELLEVYIKALVAHISTEKRARAITFKTATTHYLALRKAMQTPANPKKESIGFQVEVERERIRRELLFMLEDNDPTKAEYRIRYAWRTLDRVKFHKYKNKYKPKGY